jgi:RNA recognition motif-containing protein
MECKKSDILEIFLDYGPIEGVEIVKDDDFLHFARVTFKFVVDAMAAVDDLENEEELILGEPLRISWSSPYDVVPLYTPVPSVSVPFLSADELRPPPVHVLFSFISCQVVEQISEQIIAESFIPFGILTDANIKKHNTVAVKKWINI